MFSQGTNKPHITSETKWVFTQKELTGMSLALILIGAGLGLWLSEIK